MSADAKVIAMLADLDSMSLFNLLADQHRYEMKARLLSLAQSAYINNEITGEAIASLWNEQDEAA